MSNPRAIEPPGVSSTNIISSCISTSAVTGIASSAIAGVVAWGINPAVQYTACAIGCGVGSLLPSIAMASVSLFYIGQSCVRGNDASAARLAVGNAAEIDTPTERTSLLK